MKNLRSLLAGAAIVGLAAWVSTLPVQSCCALPREPHPRMPQGPNVQEIRLDKQSAFLWREGKQEHMLLSVKYSGGTDEFAWVIPVESRPKIEVEKGAPFTELRRATEVRIRAEVLESSAKGTRAAGAAPGVVVLERREEGPYDLAVLQASTGGGLYQWLKENKFHITKNAKGYLNHYVDRNFYFVAARIRTGAQGNEAVAAKLRNGTIAPMHLSFQAKVLSYPLKVTAVNPGSSEMELYVAGEVLPSDEVLSATRTADPFQGGGSLKVQTFQLGPTQTKNQFSISGPPGTVHSSGDFPTLARLIPKGGKLTKYTGVLHDSQRQNDLVFAKL